MTDKTREDFEKSLGESFEYLNAYCKTKWNKWLTEFDRYHHSDVQAAFIGFKAAAEFYKPKWLPIENAPKDKNYLGAIKTSHGFGEPFICYFDDEEGHVCLHQTEQVPHRPTHFMPLPEV